MFPNLKAEMARNGITSVALSTEIGISQRSLSNRMSGKTEFSRLEMVKILSIFEGLTIEYLFEAAKHNTG